MSEHLRTGRAPAAGDRIQVIEPHSAIRISAIVETASDALFVLRLEQAMNVPEEASVRWVGGARTWQADARFEQIDATRVNCQIAPPQTWKVNPARRSPRVPLEHSRLLARIASSSVLAAGRRVHIVCLDASETGCRATWPGRTPLVGDGVDLTWDVGDSRTASELGWVAARVSRIIPLSSGAQDVCFRFETNKATQAARIRAWHQAWLQRHRQRVRGDNAA